MLYHGYRFTFAELLADDACILITKRHSTEILVSVGSISQALAWVHLVESQENLDLHLKDDNVVGLAIAAEKAVVREMMAAGGRG